MEGRLLKIISLIFLLISCEHKVFEVDNRSLEIYVANGKQDYNNANLLSSFKNFDTILNSLNHKTVSDTNLQKIQLQAFCYQGMIYEKLGNNEKAYEKHTSCKQYAENYNIEDYEIIATTNLICLADNDGDAKNLLKESFQKFKPSKKNEYSLNQLRHKLAIIEAKQGNFLEGKSIAKKMLESSIYDNHEKVNTKGNLYGLLGEIYSFEAKFDSALLNYKKALELLEGYSLESGEIYLLIAKNYLTQKKFSLADNTLKKVQSLIGSDDIILKKELNELYLNVYKANGNAEKGLNTLSTLRDIDNKLNDEKNKIQGYISDKLKIDNLVADKTLHQARIKYISGIGFLSLLLFSLLHFFKQTRNRKEKLELEVSTKRLAVKNKELEVRYKELELTAINKVIDAQEEKEKEFAEILHDNVGANLSALNMFLSTLQKDVPEKKYKHLTKVLSTTILNTRSLSHLLEPPVLKSEGLISAITEKAEELTFDGLNIEVNSPIEFVALEDNLSRSLYNTILEFMNNTMRHSEATKMQIDFDLTNNNFLAVKVADNGKGFDTNNIQQSKGLGLNSIRSRVNYFNGTFNIQSSNKGTIINITVPAKAVLKQGA